MFQVRIHGRGGQGVVSAAEMLSVAAFEDGKHAQAFPTFGSERAGAPVTSFCRIDEWPLRSREPVSEPDTLIIQDPTLLHQVKVFAGLLEDGYVRISGSASSPPASAPVACSPCRRARSRATGSVVRSPTLPCSAASRR
jgi:pyruvate ferredoxin oxidoreductase gamma subunit